MKKEKIKVIFIGGSGRCGSTILQEILAASREICAGGEICYTWDNGFLFDLLCSCGKKFSECGFWESVFDAGFGGKKNVDAQLIDSSKKILMGKKAISMFLMPFLRTGKFKEAFSIYSSSLYKLFWGIKKTTGCGLILDSSKFGFHGLILSEMDMIDLYVIHLVRDPRGVAYSFQKKMLRPEVHQRPYYMSRLDAGKSGARWIKENLLSHFLRIKNRRYFFIKYEDFVSDPGVALKKIYKFLDLSPPFSHDNINGPFQKSKEHTVSGNPLRFDRKPFYLRLDNEWMKKLPKTSFSIVSLMTSPLLFFYKYKI